MGKHKKINQQQVSKIQRWLAEDAAQERLRAGKRLWSQEDTVCKWGVYQEPNKDGQTITTIKRFIKFKDGRSTWQRLKKPFYKDYLNSKRELENLVIYLNGLDPDEHRAGIKYKLKESYIPRVHVIKFQRMVRENFLNKDKKDIDYRLGNFIMYGLNWFQEQTEKVNEWKKFEKRWGECLINMSSNIKPRERIFPEGELKSKNTLVRIVWMMNQFLEYLHEVYPNKYPPMRFNPISKSQFNSLLKERKALELVRERTHIKDSDWIKIQEAIKDDPHLKIIQLCYEFGLRRSEALSLTIENLFIDNLHVKEQVWKVDYNTDSYIFKPTKTGDPRRIPYKASQSKLTPQQIAKIIDGVPIISPNQLTKKWRAKMIALGLKYDIHDCRWSFCRYAVNAFPLKTAMEYTGHKSIETINGYLQSKTEHSKEKLSREDLGLAG